VIGVEIKNGMIHRVKYRKASLTISASRLKMGLRLSD
jgi:hypothetical protein